MSNNLQVFIQNVSKDEANYTTASGTKTLTSTAKNNVANEILKYFDTNKNGKIDLSDEVPDVWKGILDLSGLSGTQGYTAEALAQGVDSLVNEAASMTDDLPDAIEKTPLEGEALDEAQNDAYNEGYLFAKHIVGYTDGDDLTEMKKYIKRGHDKQTVKSFLQGYYANSCGWNSNGFFEQIAAERGKTRLTNGEVVPVMAAIKEIFDADPNIKQTSDYKEFCRIYAGYKNKDPNKHFTNEDGSWWYRVWGCDDLDRLDDIVNKLLDCND